MNYLFCAFRLKNVFLFPVPTLKHFKAFVTTSRNTHFSSPCSLFKVNQDHLLQLPKQCLSVRMYASTASTVPTYKKETYSEIWVAERVVSLGLLSLIPMFFGDASLESAEPLLDVLIALHVHWGLEAIFKDYLRPSVVGELVHKFCDVYAALISVYLAVALLWISIYGIGVIKTVKHLWFLDPNIEK